MNLVRNGAALLNLKKLPVIKVEMAFADFVEMIAGFIVKFQESEHERDVWLILTAEIFKKRQPVAFFLIFKIIKLNLSSKILDKF